MNTNNNTGVKVNVVDAEQPMETDGSRAEAIITQDAANRRLVEPDDNVRKQIVKNLTQGDIISGFNSTSEAHRMNGIKAGRFTKDQIAVWINELIRMHGDRQTKLRDAYGAALVQTQYVKFIRLAGPRDNTVLAKFLADIAFLDEEGEFLPTGTTITVHEHNLGAHCWLKVITPGNNEVVYHVNNHDDDAFVLASTVEHTGWMLGEEDSEDLETFAQFFGMQYDEDEQAVIIQKR